MYTTKIYFNDKSVHLLVGKTSEIVKDWLKDYLSKYDGAKSKRRIVRHTEPVRSLATTVNLISKKDTAYYALGNEKLIKFSGIDDLLKKLDNEAKGR